MNSHPMYPNILQFKNLNKHESLSHFTTTRKGGVSIDRYESFNLSLYSGDKLENVKKNQAQLTSVLGITQQNLYIPYQTHQDNICIIDSEFLNISSKDREKRLSAVDALITNQKNIAIGITTADCVPIILYDPVQQILATIHSGWKGTVKRISSKTVDLMVKRFKCLPQNIYVGIGPSISKSCFEVGDEVVENFIKEGFTIDEIATKNLKTNKYHIDLWKTNQFILLESGIKIKNIEIAKLCTFIKKDLFFSARRQGIESGRMLTGGIIK